MLTYSSLFQKSIIYKNLYTKMSVEAYLLSYKQFKLALEEVKRLKQMTMNDRTILFYFHFI